MNNIEGQNNKILKLVVDNGSKSQKVASSSADEGMKAKGPMEEQALSAIDRNDPESFRSAMDSLVGDGFPYDDARRKEILERCEQIQDTRLRDLVLMDDTDLDMQALIAAEGGDQEKRDYFLRVAECTILWWKGFHCREICEEFVNEIKGMLAAEPSIPPDLKEHISGLSDNALANCNWDLIEDIRVVLQWVKKVSLLQAVQNAEVRRRRLKVVGRDGLYAFKSIIQSLGITDAETRRGKVKLLKDAEKKGVLALEAINAFDCRDIARFEEKVEMIEGFKPSLAIVSNSGDFEKGES